MKSGSSLGTRKMIENLEARTLMAAVSISIDADRILHVYGTNQADNIGVNMHNNMYTNQMRATILNGSKQKTFWNIVGVRVYLNGGNDTFRASSTDISFMPYNEVSTPFHLAVYGGAGNDTFTIKAFDGEIAAYGEDGKDVFNGKQAIADDDILGMRSWRSFMGGNGNDIFHGSASYDSFSGEGGDDYGYGGDGADGLYGGAGNDILNGGNDNDFLEGGTGKNTLSGGAGDDIFAIYPLQPIEPHLPVMGGYDVLVGGAGNDTVWRMHNEVIAPPSGWNYGIVSRAGIESVIDVTYGKG